MLTSLTTAELLLLLAHHPTRYGYLTDQVSLTTGCTGAMLLDLFDEGALALVGEKVQLVRQSTELSESHQRILLRMHESGKVRSVKNWMSRLGHRNQRRVRSVRNQLVEKGFFQVEDRRFLGIPYQRTYVTQPDLQAQLVQVLRAVLFQGENCPEPLQPLLSLLVPCKLQRAVAHDRAERSALKARVKEAIARNETSQVVGKAVRREIEAAIAASIVVISASVVVTSS